MIGTIRSCRLSQMVIAVTAAALAAIPLPAQANMLTIKLCSADGEVRNLSLPVKQERDQDQCVKPCHACLSRKKIPKI